MATLFEFTLTKGPSCPPNLMIHLPKVSHGHPFDVTLTLDPSWPPQFMLHLPKVPHGHPT